MLSGVSQPPCSVSHRALWVQSATVLSGFSQPRCSLDSVNHGVFWIQSATVHSGFSQPRCASLKGDGEEGELGRGRTRAEPSRVARSTEALGEGNMHAKPLLRALEVARARSQTAPLDKRIESRKSFLERDRKRAGRLEEAISRGTTEKEASVGNCGERTPYLPTEVDAQVDASVGLCRNRSRVQRRRGMFCWLLQPQFCRGQPQCGWEMVHLR